jgi:hypothetical protein
MQCSSCLLIGAAIFDSIESEEEQRQKEALTGDGLDVT